MKNIVILGVARAGKTTLSRMIVNKYKNYQVINGDCVRAAFQEVFPELEINRFHGKGMEKNFSYFCSELLKYEIKQNKKDFNYIFESCDITPENASKYFNLDNTLIIFLGYPNLSIEEILYNYKHYADKNDYMLKKTPEEMENRANLWSQKSKEYKELCEKNNIKFIDVSYDRKLIFDKLVNELETDNN